MHSTQDHAHYMPTSVGALMDPGFLRRAVDDFNEPDGAGVQPDAEAAAHGWRSSLAAARALMRKTFLHDLPRG